MKKIKILSVVCVLALAGLRLAAQEQAFVESFAPQGTVKQVRQVSARFSEPMVALGDPRLIDPFEVSCPVAGKGRWVDARSWAYDFKTDLPSGLVCDFRLKPGLKTLSGKAVLGQNRFRFTTGGPAIRETWPEQGAWSPIDERQVFILTLDGAARTETIVKQTYFSVPGIRERVGVNILKGPERDKVLKAAGRTGEAKGLVVLQARQAFPAAVVVKLVWGKGIAAPTGVATSQDQTLSFKVRDAFSAYCGCERERPDGPCIPVLPIQLSFTAPVSKADAGRIVLKHKDGRVWKARPVDYGSQGGKDTRRVIFDGPFPEKSAFSIMLPTGLRDDTGRALINQSRFPLAVKTGGYPVLAKFSSRFGILEKADPVLPVTVRNIEAQAQKTPAPATVGAKQAGQSLGKEMHLRLFSIEADKEALMINWLRTVAKAKRDTSLLKGKALVREMVLPRRGRANDFEVVGIPLPGPGLHLVEMESRLLGNSLLQKPAPMFVPSLALVTNLAVHFKEGQENALVWVTALDSGQPVRDAAVTIRDSYGTLLWQGRSDARGVALVDRHLVERELGYEHCMTDEYAPGLENLCQGFFVFARTIDDMTFTHSSWRDGIEPWRFNLPEADASEDANNVAHTILDRSLLRAGETVHMKHIIRTQTSAGFGLPKDARLPQTAVLMHLGSDQEYRVPVTWQKGGAGECAWKIPEAAKLGTYHIYLQTAAPDAKPEDIRARYFTGKVRVEEFRVPLMKAVIQPPKGEHIRPQAMDIDLTVAYLSGGGASGLPVKLRAEVRHTTPVYRGYEGFNFTGGALKAGVVGRSVRMDRDSFDEEEGEYLGDEQGFGVKPVRLPTQELTCDANGAVRARLAGIPRVDRPSVIHAELEFRDANGEAQTAATNIPVHPSRWVVGINTDTTFSSSGVMKYTVAVLDVSGHPVKGATVAIDFFQQIVHSHRVRLVGGFYGYQNTREIKTVGKRITGTTDGRGLLFCSTRAPVSGEVMIQAGVTDAAGNTATANAGMWVSGKDAQWFEQGNDERIDVIPVKRQYEPGETARFQVRMPFSEATALVSVEREGVMDLFVRSLSGVNPVVDVPIRKNYAPNVFVSVLVVRGRVGGTRPTATFDPGKPAYKLGIAEINVGWKGHRLNVEVIPDKQTYQIREAMQVHFKVRKAEDGLAPSSGEITVAAVDEGLLELLPNESWRLLDAMMQRRGYGVKTATAQGLVVGKRHFGLKALPHGGGGGKQMTRELFDTLLFWKATLALDAKGEARAIIPLNDSLTGFRIVAIATGGDDLFGTGEASVRTTQDLMLLSDLPQLVREGDRFMAGGTLRNATKRNMDIEADLAMNPPLARQSFKSIRISIPAGEARPIAWPLIVPYDTDRLTYTMTARDMSGGARDRLQVMQKVVPAVPVRTFQATLEQVRGDLKLDVASPADALPGRGGIALELMESLGQGLDGVREYMQAYPYGCLEQRVSRAVALKDKALWEAIVKQMPAYLDKDGLLKYFPCAWCSGSDILTAYVLSITHQAGYTIPEYLKQQMTTALKAFVEGHVVRDSALPTADLTFRKLSAVEAMSRYETVDTKLLSTIAIDPNLWPTSAVIDWLLILQRVNMPQRNERLSEAQQILKSRLNLQGTTMGFATEKTDYLWWLMVSGDVNAAKALLALLPMQAWAPDMPRMARGLIGRMQRGRWDTTPANAWGVLAIQAFAGKFENIPVKGRTDAGLSGQSASLDWRNKAAGDTLEFAWPKQQASLSISHTGTGAPWAMIRSRAAIPLKEKLSTGFAVKKTVIPVEQKRAGFYSRGDVVRVRLDLEAQSDMTWVAVNDPIPAGAIILQADLGSGSSMLTAGEGAQGRAWPAYTERGYEAFRQYFEFVPKGRWTVEYTLRFNTEGTFTLPGTRVEALYAPEMFGETPNAMMVIKAD